MVRRILLALCMLLVCAGPGWAGQNVLDTDTFNGTNGNTLPTYSGNWLTVPGSIWGDLTIQGTPGFGTTSGYNANRNTSQTWTNDQWAEIQIDGTNVPSGAHTFDRLQVMLRVSTSASSGYACGVDVPNAANIIYRIIRYDSSTYTSLAAEPGSTTAGASDVVNCQIVGTVITMKVTNGGTDRFTPFTYDTVSDGTKYSSGDVGILGAYDTSSVRLGGSWRAGSVTADGGSCGTMLMGVSRPC